MSGGPQGTGSSREPRDPKAPRPPRRWVLPLAVGLAAAVIVFVLIVVIVSGQRFF
ncbi:hypothetical protein [Schumannella soli]|uniref:hypothetical protein n=1 Tax=Schumannella soli TaxID=2590779 RepID=UPI0015E8551F|nr:hypothetical protein [Schumannella soli]